MTDSPRLRLVRLQHPEPDQPDLLPYPYRIDPTEQLRTLPIVVPSAGAPDVPDLRDRLADLGFEMVEDPGIPPGTFIFGAHDAASRVWTVSRDALGDEPDFTGWIHNELRMLIDARVTGQLVDHFTDAADRVTPEQREQLRLEHERRAADQRAAVADAWRRYDLSLAAIGSVDHELTRLVLEHHGPHEPSWPGGWITCEGCDAEGYDVEPTAWPCSTTRLIFDHEALTDLLPTIALSPRTRPSPATQEPS